MFNAPKQNGMWNLERFWKRSLLSKKPSALFPLKPSRNGMDRNANLITWVSINFTSFIWRLHWKKGARFFTQKWTLSKTLQVSHAVLLRCVKQCSAKTHFSSLRSFNINDVLNKNKNEPNNPVQASVLKKDILVVLPHLGLQSNQVTKHLKSCVNNFYFFVNLKTIFQNTRHIKSYFPNKDRLSRSQRSKVIYKAGCWNCDEFYILAKQNEDSMTGKQNISRLSLKATIHQPLLIMWKPLVTT